MRATATVVGCLVAAALSIFMVAPAPAYDVPKEMTRYWVAVLVRGPAWTATDSPELQAIVRGHLAYIRTMIEERKYLLAGPFLDGGVRQGMAILAARSEEEARRLVGGDPAVVAGRLAVELHPAMLPSLATLQVRY